MAGSRSARCARWMSRSLYSSRTHSSAFQRAWTAACNSRSVARISSRWRRISASSRASASRSLVRAANASRARCQLAAMSSLRSIIVAPPDESAREVDDGGARVVEVYLLSQDCNLIVEDPALESPLTPIAGELLFEPDDFVPPFGAQVFDDSVQAVELQLGKWKRDVGLLLGKRR